MTGRRLNTLLSVDTRFIITEAFSHHIAPPERPVYPDRLCKGGYQAINRRQSCSAAATWLLTSSLRQTRGGSVQCSFFTSSLLSHTLLASKNTPLSYLSAKRPTHRLHGQDRPDCTLVLGHCMSVTLINLYGILDTPSCIFYIFI